MAKQNDTIKIGHKSIKVTELTRRQILENLDKLQKSMSPTEIDELWLNSKKSVKA